MIGIIKKYIENLIKFERVVTEYETASSKVLSPAKAYINWGVRLAQSGNMAEAIEKFKYSVAISPDLSAANINWGVALAKSGKFQEAILQFEEASHKSPHLPIIYNLWGGALTELGSYQEAIEKYERALKFIPKSAEVLTNLGIVYAKTNNYYDAEACFHKALKVHPNAVQPNFFLGVISAEQGYYKKATEHFKELTLQKPDHKEAYHFWSVSLNKCGIYEEALEKAIYALELDPHDYKKYVNKGDILTNLEQLDEAIINYQLALQINQNGQEANFGLGIAYSKAGNIETAFDYFSKVLYLNPNAYQAMFSIGNIYLDKKQYDRAIEYFKAALEINAEYIDAIHNLSLCYAKLQEDHNALNIIKEGLSILPHHPQLNYMYATKMLEQGKYDEAIQVYEKILTREPNNIEAKTNLALCLSEANRNEDAIRMIRSAAKHSASIPEIQFLYGLILSKDPRWKIQSLEKFHTAINLNPSYFEAYAAWGETLISLHRFDEALTVIKKSLEIKPDYTIALLLQGALFSELSIHKKEQQAEYSQKALDCFHKVIDLDENCLEAFANIAFLQGKEGNPSTVDELFKSIKHRFDKTKLNYYWSEVHKKLRNQSDPIEHPEE